MTTDAQGLVSYTATAGGDGGGIYQNGGTVNLNAGSISGRAAGNGGGLYSKNTVNHTGGDITGSAANGGGVYKTTQNHYNFSGGTITGTATGNGGTVYHDSNQFNLSGTAVIGEKVVNGQQEIASAARNGGGLYLAGGTFNMNGADVYVAGATASQNGGGVYVAGGTYNFNGGSIADNTADGNGGGVYYAGGTFNMSGNGASKYITGNTADKGAGVFVANGMSMKIDTWDSYINEIRNNHAVTEGGGIAVGGANAVLNFKNKVIVRDNTMGSTNIACNVYLDLDSNTVIKNNWLDPASYIGVYVKDEQQESHGLPGLPFGTYSSDANLDVYHNDRLRYLSGTKGSDNLVKWSEFVCKITDGEGNLLYKDAKGTPAVYSFLENDITGSAFKTLNVTTPALYPRDSDTLYSGDYQIQMLVQEYPLTKQITLSNEHNITLTTASSEEDECGFKYLGNNRIPASIIRQGNFESLFKVSKGNMTFDRITVDGGYSKDRYTATDSGGLLRVENSNTVVTIMKDATFCNSYIPDGKEGGAIFNTGTLYLNGGTITDCGILGTKNWGGGISVDSSDNSAKMYINDGIITNCSGANTGGLRINRAKVYINGCTITGNTANAEGGGISFGRDSALVYFSGLCNVTGNTVAGSRNNMQLTYDKNTIINANGLDARSEIGVYTANGTIYNKHGVSGAPFGTWSTQDDKLFCFVNDRSTNLRGYQSIDTSDTNIYWEYHPLLTVGKAVSSDLSADRDKTFSFTVRLPGKTTLTQTERNAITGMSFKSDGTATLTLKAGESATAIFPDSFDKLDYEVTENLSGDAAEDFAATATRNGADYAFTADKPLTVSGQLGENIGTANSTSLSNVVFTNTRATGDLTVSKQVVSDVESDKAESFDFKVTLKDTGISKTFETTKRDADNNKTVGTLIFTAGVSDAFSLKDGESLTIKGLPTDLKYTVEEILTVAQKANIRTQVSKDSAERVYALSQEGTIGEKYTTETVEDVEKTVYASEVAFTNNFQEIVCKITNRSRALLYYRDAAGNLQPAIFAHLEDAFDQINSGNLRTSGNGTVSGALRIEMVVPEYTMEKTAVLNSGKTVTLSTALPSDEDYPYNKGESDGDNISTVYRGFEEGGMIVDNGVLTIDKKIVLDGGSTLSEPVATTANGGIINVAGRVRLTVNSAAKLQNSVTTGQGGAIWLDSGASLTMNGTISNCSAASGGGVYASNGFTTIATTGTITGCKATSGNGGAIYASKGTSVNLNAGTALTGNTASDNGGAVYTEANLILRGSVGGAGNGEGNTAGGDGGGIYMGEGTTFTMYAGSSISGNRANNGGGLATVSTARIAGGTIQNNTAQPIVTGEGDEQTSTGGHGGAVYAAGNAVVTISGAPVITGNEAVQGGAVYNGGIVTMTGGAMTGNTATEKGGAVYVASEKTFTMSGGSIKDSNKSPEGAVSTAANATLAFSGNAVISGNTDTVGTTVKNVYLGYDSNAIITSSGLGSSANIGIYVADGEPEDESVENHVDNPIYADHGVGGRDFGTYTGSNLSGARLNKFVNDRDTTLTGRSGTLTGGTQFIAWTGKGLELKVTQYLIQTDSEGNPVLDDKGDPVFSEEVVPVQNASFTFTRLNGDTETKVWSGKSSTEGIVTIPWGGSETEDGNVASFVPGSVYRLDQTAAAGKTVLPAGHWKVTIGRDNSVTWEVEQGDGNVDRTLNIDLPEKAFLGETFGLKNDVKPTLTYNVNGDGKLSDNNTERTDIIAFTTKETSHSYIIKETNPTWDSHVFRTWATMKEKPEGDDGAELTGEELTAKGYYEYERENNITFYRGTDSAEPAVKYAQSTSKGDMTLYAQWDEVVCKITDRYGVLLYINGSPAVYGSLEDGFEAYNNAGIRDFTYENGSRANARRIEMLVGSYTLEKPLTVERGKTVMLTTAPSTDTDGYAYTGEDNTVCVITRGKSCDGSMITNHSNLTLMNIVLDGNGHRGDGEDDRVIVTDGGIVNNAQASAVLTIAEGATLRNSWVEGNGGAINASADTTVDIRGGTINGNTATEGAGIYLAENSRLYLSGSPNFGGTGTADLTGTDPNAAISGPLTDTDGVITNGNYQTDTLIGATNGQVAYTNARQDIYVAGYDSQGSAADSIVVTGAINLVPGSVWVWCAAQEHYEMLKQFAVFGSTAVKNALQNTGKLESTMQVFRNAQIDLITGCGADYLTGQEGDDINGRKCIYWTGGFDFVFRKIDGYGKPLDGATFTLYRANAEGTDILKEGGVPVAYQVNGTSGKVDATATSRKIDSTDAVTIKYTTDGGLTISDKAIYGDGLVTFSKIPPATYFLVETAAPEVNGKAYATTQEKYRIVLDSKGWYTITVEKDDSGASTWTKEALTTSFANDGSGKYTETDNTSATDTVKVYEIMNLAPFERKVILRKTAESDYKPLEGAVFEIYRMDDTPVSDSTGNVNFISNASGVYFIGKLPYGVYYLHEVTAPTGYSSGKWFTLTVKDDTAEGSRDGVTVSGPSTDDPRPSKQNP